MSGTYYNPLDTMTMSHIGQPKVMWAVIATGDEQPRAFFEHKEDAEVFAREGFFYPFKQGLLDAHVREYTFNHFVPARTIS